MVDLKHSEMRIIETAFQADPGYVLNFSDRTFREFFEDELHIDIDDKRYRQQGSSKMNRLRAFLKTETPTRVAAALRALWSYRESLTQARQVPDGTQHRLFALIAGIESGEDIARTDAIDRFSNDETLEELVAAIERDIQADRPGAALDRLHTYCTKKFGHLLDQRGISWTREEPLHSRVGKYVRALQSERELRNMTLQILKNAIGVFDKFNHVRNNQTLAHDNELPDKAEARFIFDSVTAILRFVRAVDTVRYESSVVGAN
ncbi:abortive infection family protein [Rhizobium johnstonii]|uniref:abortive infection family protein n=1 Tax=Rhizobium johnstonii TaxID=3019933 RepID=UPI003F9C36AA